MISRLSVLLVLITLFAGCARVSEFAMMAAEKRRSMNDGQARATMVATCDISVGAYFRELNELERRYAAELCGGVAMPEMPSQATIDAWAARMDSLVYQVEATVNRLPLQTQE